MKLVLIRHTSVAVPKGVCYGQSDVDTTETFAEEAADVKKRLAGYSFDRVYASPLSRCMKLARFCGYDRPTVDPRLMEINFGEWEMKRFDEISDPRLQEWFDDYINVRATGGESSVDQRRRFESFLHDLKAEADEDETVAVFTHGGILIHALVMFAGQSYKDTLASHPPYGAIIELDI